MKILKRITENGSTVGYTIDEGGIILPMCNDALYTEFYIRPLTEAGYKYFSRNADEIVDPDGVSLASYESIELSTIDSVEWLASLDLAATSMLSDVDASVFYTFREESVISFRTEPSYEINTREEFIAYLKGLKYTFYSTSYSIDNRPINSFVHPDALFTIDEIIANPEYKLYFDIMAKRHCMKDFAAYRNLVSWLMNKGVLSTANPTMAEFLEAYYAWGPDGLKDKCTNVEAKLSVDGLFSFTRDPLSNRTPEDYVLSNRENKVAIVDANQGLHFLKTHESTDNITDVKDFGRARLAISSNDTIMAIRRTQFDGYKYQAVKGTLYSDVSDRLYITLLSESGYTYIYKVAHDQYKLGLANTSTNSSVVSSKNNFAVASIIPSIMIPINMLRDSNDYYLWNLSIIKTASLIKDRTFEVPYRSTADFLLSDGVNPIAVIDYISNAISKKNTFEVNCRYELSQPDDDFNDALDLYLSDIPEYILEVFGLVNEELPYGPESFLELADIDNLNDRREAMMNGQLSIGDEGFDVTYKKYQSTFSKTAALMSDAGAMLGRGKVTYDAIDYYTKLKLVSDCLHGNLSIDNFGDGQLADAGASYRIAAECIMSVIYTEFGNTPDVDLASQAIINIDNSSLINISRIFKVRDKALKGYMVDYANYRKNRACDNTYMWAYCTKVFREISNAPIEKQRPYLMELVGVNNDSKQNKAIRKLMVTIVEEAIEEANISDTRYGFDGTSMGEWSDRRCAKMSTEFIAAKLFFFIMAGGVKDEPVDGVHSVKMNMYDSRDLVVKVPADVVAFVRNYNIEENKVYITVYDYCRFEYNPDTVTGTFSICLVNADVDPWHVKPKKGYSIKSYGLIPNYYEQATLDKVNGENFYLTACNNKEIVVSPIRESQYKKNAGSVATMTELLNDENECRMAQDPSELDGFLSRKASEPIFAYVRRWALERKKANNLGKRLYSIPLKQDIVYNSLASIFCDDIPSTEATYVSDTSFDDKASQKITTVRPISWRDYENNVALLTTKKNNVVERLSVEDIELYNVGNIKHIISGEWKSSIPVLVSGNYITIISNDKTKLFVPRLTQEDISNFVSAGIIYPISQDKYYLTAINGDYILTI